MPIYAIGILPLMSTIVADSLPETLTQVKQVAFADDLTGAGTIDSVKLWWDQIITYGPYLGYNAKPSKSWLIVKNEYVDYAKEIFSNTGLNITTDERRHLGAVIGTDAFKQIYVNNLIENWVEEIVNLSEIAKTEPHVAYTAFTHGLKHRYSYAMRTIPNISENLKVLDTAITDHFIAALFKTTDLIIWNVSYLPYQLNMGALI